MSNIEKTALEYIRESYAEYAADGGPLSIIEWHRSGEMVEPDYLTREMVLDQLFDITHELIGYNYLLNASDIALIDLYQRTILKMLAPGNNKKDIQDLKILFTACVHLLSIEIHKTKVKDL